MFHVFLLLIVLPKHTSTNTEAISNNFAPIQIVCLFNHVCMLCCMYLHTIQ